MFNDWIGVTTVAVTIRAAQRLNSLRTDNHGEEKTHGKVEGNARPTVEGRKAEERR